MLKNYLKVAIRNVLQRKVHSIVNIAGLATGMACCLIICQYIFFEFNFDAFNTDAANLFRVTQTRIRSGSEPDISALGGYAMGPALAQQVPEVERFARLHPDFGNPVVSHGEKPEVAFEEPHIFYADPAFLDMFSYPLIMGDPATALSAPGTMLISASTARRYFGTENPIGQTLNVTGWIDGGFQVNGVFRDVPVNSHLQFDFLLPMRDLLQKSNYSDPKHGWNWQNFYTYVRLRDDTDVPAVERKFTEVLQQNRGEELRRAGISARLNAQPLLNIHLNSAVFAPKVAQVNARTVSFFAIIALITFIIALVNYINLATARSQDRSREVGLRRVVGAQRRQLVFQFLFETAFTNLGAIVLAIGLAEVLRPLVNDFAGTQLSNQLSDSPIFGLALLATFGTSTLLAGLYPAFVLSSFRPVAVLKGKSGSPPRRLRLRQGLVVLQFAASIALLAGTTIVYSQLQYMRRMDIGIRLEQILTVPGPRVLADEGDAQATRVRAMQRLINELRQVPAIHRIATSSALPGQGFNWYSTTLRRTTADPSTAVSGALAWVDTSFAALYGLELIAGRGFDGMAIEAQAEQPRPVIANETAIRAIGFDTPIDALQQSVNMGGQTFRIVGVYKDFNWSSAHLQREAALFAPTPAGSELSIKVGTENLPETIAAIERIYKGLFPGNPFRYDFADEKFAEAYRNDQRFAALFSVFAGLAILIACLGLFGLASFSAQQRTKEIGIRKVLGASVASVTALLSKDFVKLVLLANLIAWPLAWLAMNQWLQNFAYRIEISWWMFALAGGLALLIALLTVSTQAVRAALANPVESLRSE